MDRWYGDDELRNSWCLITLDATLTEAETYINACEVGVGNTNQLIRAEMFSAEAPAEEPQLLQALGTEFDEHRYNGVTIITPRERTLRILRTRLLGCEAISQPTLRGFNHLAIADVIDTYFETDCADWPPAIINSMASNKQSAAAEHSISEIVGRSVEALWNARTSIGPLVPSKALQGKPL